MAWRWVVPGEAMRQGIGPTSVDGAAVILRSWYSAHILQLTWHMHRLGDRAH